MRLQAKLLAVFLPMAAVSGGLLVLFSGKTVQRIVIDEKSDRALAEMSELAQEAREGFEKRNESLLLSHLQDSQAVVGSIYAMAFDTEGKVLAHTNVAETDKIYKDSFTTQALRADHPLTKRISWNGEEVLDISCPVYEGADSDSGEEFLLSSGAQESTPQKRLGTLQFGVPLKDALQTQQRISRQIGWIILSIGLLMFGLASLLMRKFLSPVSFLAQATESIGRGKYDAQIPVLSNDELGGLAASFNQMSEALAKTTVSKGFLDAVLESMLDGLIVLHDDGAIRKINLAGAVLLGQSPEDLLGKPLREKLVFPTGSEAMERLFQGEPVKNAEASILTPDGRMMPVLFTASLLKEQDNRSGGYIVGLRDITDRKKLENIVQRSEKMTAVGQLAAGVAHEINNPLGVILGFAQGLVNRLQPNDPQEMPLKSIEREALRCKNLVQDLLTFSRATQAERLPLELNEAVESALSLVQVQARVREIHIEKGFASSLPRILGNRNQLQQVVINLANNAMDAMPKGGTLKIGTEFIEEKPLSWVCLKVTDTGSGIPKEILSKIFDPFFTTKPVGQGTGLGLSLVHEIITKHSGKMDVESQPGRTEFRLRFPVRTGPEMEQRAAAFRKGSDE